VALAGATEVEEVLQVIAARALPELGQTVLSLWMTAPAGDAIRLVGGYGYVPSVPDQVGGVPLDSDLPAAVAVAEQRPVWYGSRRERNERWPSLAAVGGRSEATVVMPLIARGEAFGCLAFGFDEARTFDAEQLAVFEAVTGECALALDRVRLIERERNTRRVLEFLGEATQLLVASRDPVELVDRLAGLAVPELSDWCAIYLAEEAGLRVVATKPDVATGSVRQRLAEGRLVIPYDSPVPAARVWRSGVDEEVADVAAEIHRASLEPEVGSAARTLGVTSATVVPIRASGEVIGIMSTAYSPTRVRSDVHRFAIDGLAARAGVALANAQRLERELEAVKVLTAALLPRTLPVVPGYELAALYLPASGRVCGDWYEAAVLPDGDVLLGVGDAAGHGIEASSMMAAFRNAATSQAITGAGPADILRVLAVLGAMEEPDPVFATALYLRLDPATGTMRLASAGHLPPVLYRHGVAELVCRPQGVPIGAMADPTYEEDEFDLEAEGLVVIVTDGVVERRGEMISHGLDRLLQVVQAVGDRPADVVTRHIGDALCGGREDDCCIVALRRVGTGS
jgi:serine/threonine-protein kinase RsbW